MSKHSEIRKANKIELQENFYQKFYDFNKSAVLLNFLCFSEDRGSTKNL